MAVPESLRRLLPTTALVLALLLAAAPARSVRGAAPAPLPIVTGNQLLDGAERVALDVLGRDLLHGLHIAAPYYNSAWIRDSYAWGMIPWSGSLQGPAYPYAGSELTYWLGRQRPYGAWITNDYSGWYDETPILIAAIADSYRLTGDRPRLRQQLPQAERAFAWLVRREIRPREGSRYLLYAAIGPHTAADWADQVARRGYATGLEALWYRAATSMAEMEAASGQRDRVGYYRSYARGIARDINRLLWRVGAPHARNAPRASPTGHYTGWRGGTDYFELDSNFLCILYGIAGPSRRAAILRFTSQHADYLLGLDTPGRMPARVLYGDYEPRDYARIHYGITDGTYQNAYWADLGALVAMGYAQSGDGRMARAVLERIAVGFLRQGTAHEWYGFLGAPSGAYAYQWPARMYLIALYSAYLGLEDTWRAGAGSPKTGTTIRCLGPGRASIEQGGREWEVLITASPVGTGRCRATARPSGR